MDHVSVVCRRQHLSRRTEQAYRFWIRKYIRFHNRQQPRSVGPDGIVGFVNRLATVGLAASTQSQALNALLFLYRDVLEVKVGYPGELRYPRFAPSCRDCYEATDTQAAPCRALATAASMKAMPATPSSMPGRSRSSGGVSPATSAAIARKASRYKLANASK
jgi:hypothetical protein